MRTIEFQRNSSHQAGKEGSKKIALHSSATRVIQGQKECRNLAVLGTVDMLEDVSGLPM
jgi:hypothetical protein